VNERSQNPASSGGQQNSAAAREGVPRTSVDRFTVGKLLEHGAAPHEFHRGAPESYYVKLVTDSGPQTIWSAGLKSAFERSRTQPQPGDQIGVRENNFDPVSVVVRKRNPDGIVTAERSIDTPRPHWVVEKLAQFDLRAAAARTLRDPTVSRREASMNYRELKDAYTLLDTAKKHAENTWENPQTRAKFVQALRETLAEHIERGEEVPRLTLDQDRTVQKER
jgi:hypothetical protein